ncbi:VOC family protein [Dactylosporangium roseum]|uniref:VOC family protein n=1 Tax=Dactylosporangium roseum TaxID=47989 RepID=A0ABY5ZBE9_9ACTN|nr:VOC family protein [Dactylosporangium roseum]UWZ39356.1 VOC family protein [Dactylosporangium roseum]
MAPFIWFDLLTTDPAAARAFYTGLFGWDAADGADPYTTWFTSGDGPWAGIAAGDAPGRWLPFVVVDDLDNATRRAVELGGTVVAAAAEGPAGTSVTIADPGGAHLALFRPRG